MDFEADYGLVFGEDFGGKRRYLSRFLPLSLKRNYSICERNYQVDLTDCSSVAPAAFGVESWVVESKPAP